MRAFTPLVSILAAASVAISAAIPDEPWTHLTPTGSSPSGAVTDYDGSFALTIITLSAAPTSGAKKRDVTVTQIGDGQVQVHTVVNQIADGQVQHQTAAVVNQIGDGQVQHQTAAVVNQIGDGQVQHQTAAVVNQIGDGQVQHQTAAAVNQIADGQIQHQTAAAVNQIGDGQVQHQTAAAANQIGDGQVQATAAAQAGDGQVQNNGAVVETCVTADSLVATLKGGVLRDAKGRIGAIVANQQFQFDGPPPQAGTIYAAGWSVVPDSKGGFQLALGDQTTFYQCLSGDFYNLYDKSIGAQCAKIEIGILKAISC
ncbi:uncharacterized protein RJT20DRAFT_130837 [Scheffersomyces xylosifermentans]|uniref:uncharacterized protein n=1 Tax=Scheffersomyces xylosifermentans TaxID=1304137 RepID=UPI00315CBA43